MRWWILTKRVLGLRLWGRAEPLSRDERLKCDFQAARVSAWVAVFMAAFSLVGSVLALRLMFNVQQTLNAHGMARHRLIWFFPMTIYVSTIVVGIASVGAFRRARRLSRQLNGNCAQCGYDLCATPDRCPECGRVAG